MAARELFKRCECPPARWPKCPHSWYFRRQVAGRRWNLCLDEWLGHPKCRSVADADKVRDQIVGLLKAGTFSPLGPPEVASAPRPAPVPAGVTFAEAVAAFVESARSDPERSPKYCANLASCLRQAVAWRLPEARGAIATLGDLPVGAVTSADLETFCRSQAGGEVSNSYRNKTFYQLRRLGRWAVSQGYRREAWLEKLQTGIKRRTEARRHRRLAVAVVDPAGNVIRPSEEDRLLAAAGPHLRDLIVAALESAQRLAELLAVQWQDIDLGRRRMRVYDCKDRDRVIYRDIPISARLLEVLIGRTKAIDGSPMEPDAYVFGNEIGEPIGNVLTAWENAVIKAAGQPVTRDRESHGLTPAARAAYRRADLKFHDLRHEAGSRLIEAGWPLHQVAAMLGHKNIATTTIYLNVRAGDLDAQMRALDLARAGSAPEKWSKVAQRSDPAPPPAARPRGKKSAKPLVH